MADTDDHSGDAGARSALIIVRNPCTHDSRVIREAETLAGLGYRPSILAVVSTQVTERHGSAGGFPILRLAPTSPIGWLRARLSLRRRGEGPRGAAAEPATPQGEGAPRAGPLGAALIRVHRWLRTLDFYRRAIRVLRRTRPALLHCNDYNTMWVGVAARLMGGTAVVYDAHELWPDRNLRPEPRWWLLACEWLFVRCAHRNVTASPGYAEVMAARYRIPPPAVVRNIPARPPRDAAQDGPATGPATYVGALTRNRGLEIAIAAVGRLPEGRLRFVGPVSDAYRAELVELAKQEGMLDRLEISGAIPPAELIDAIADASAGLALIQPECLSYELSLPNKVFEYVSAGVPVLASDLPVMGRFVSENEIGLVAKPDDPADVAAKLVEMMRPERNAELRRAVRRAADEMRWEQESRILGEEYSEAAERVR